MTPFEEVRARLKSGAGPAIEPEYVRVQDACGRYGFSRSGIYKLAAEHKIRLVKLAGATLVDCASVRAFMSTLPLADIRVGQSRAAA